MITIVIDDKEYEVEEGKNLLEVSLSLGYDLPYFCWHSALGSVGACRQCAVKKFKDDDDTEGRLVMACMEPIAKNLKVSISDPEAVQFRKTIIEWLMTNHPHDCAVCDEGGECHLQDMTVMTGHCSRRFNFNKRTHLNQYLGPFINHEMNRCIQCFRCVRFYKDYAGGKDLDVFSAHNHIYFGRSEDGILENEFSGNLVEICPTGVFSDKTLKKHYTRKWDLTSAPSICTHCSLGCNTIISERYGSARRVLNRYNNEVNGYFLCDRGRFGYEFINSENRIKQPALKSIESTKEARTSDEAIQEAVKIISNSKNVIGIGSPRASVETNYALKNLVKEKNFYAGIEKNQHSMIKRIQDIMMNYPVETPSLKEISECDAVLILGEDLTNTAPLMALALRQSVLQKPKEKIGEKNIPLWQDAAVRELIQEDKGPFYIAAPFATKLDDISTKNYYNTPKNLASFGFSIAHILDDKSPKVSLPTEHQSLALEIATALKNAKRPLIISGTSCMEPLLIEAAANIAQAVNRLNPETQISFVVPECNSMGLVMMEDKSLDKLIEEEDVIDTLIIVENDLFLRKERAIVERILKKARHIIVLDHLQNDTTSFATLIFPVGTIAESEGTFISQEGRAQRFYQVYQPEEDIKQSWHIITNIFNQINGYNDSEITFDSLIIELAFSHTKFDGIQRLTPPSDFRIVGQKIARESHRYSGRTAMHAHKNVSEEKPNEDSDSPLSFTMEGYHGKPPSTLNPFYWSPGWNSAQAINKYQVEVGGSLHDGDPGTRLLASKSDVKVKYFSEPIPLVNDPTTETINENDNMLVIPRYHIYGSDELSKHSPGVAELIPEAYIGISKETAEILEVKENEHVEVRWSSTSTQEKLKIIEGLSAGVLVMPFGLNDYFATKEQQFATLIKLHNE